MKKIVTLLLFFKIVFSQNLSLSEVLSLKKMSIGEVEEFLTQKNWQFVKSIDPTEKEYGSISFAYNKNKYDDKAEAFITYYFDYVGLPRIGLQILYEEKYLNYVSQIKKWGGELYSSYTENGNLIKIYEGSEFMYTFKISNVSYSPTYYLYIKEKKD